MTIVFDAHSDCLTDAVRKREQGDPGAFGRDRLPQMAASGIAAAIMVAWIHPDFQNAPVERFDRLIPLIDAELAECGDAIRVATSGQVLDQALRDNVPAAILGIEGASGFPDGLVTLRTLHAKGYRHLGLTWNEANALATGVRSPLISRGLTRAGRGAVELALHLGMILDVSHLNDPSLDDVLDIVHGPLVASHSNARAVCPDKRNLTDRHMRAIAKRGGVIGLNAWGNFVAKGRQATVEDFLVHLDHAVKVAGVDHVGFGFDFTDPMELNPQAADPGLEVSPDTEGLSSWRDAPPLIRLLAERGYSPEDIDKIASGNFIRVVRELLPDDDSEED